MEMSTIPPGVVRAASAALGWARQLRERFGRRAVAVLAAIAIELLLLALLFTLGGSGLAPGGQADTITTFDIAAAPPQQAEESPEQEEAADTASLVPQAASPPPPAPMPPQAAIIPLSREDMQSADIADLAPPLAQPRTGGPAYGPAFAAAPGDTEVVGRAPNGEPLYAARWYREPSRGELAGYLSTASGPGWALIACRTAPQWRVEDCVGLDEYPQGSQLQRAVLAAAWQFQVRPPRRGGQSLVGSWVRIRIEYSRS
jgi:protein TonB